MPMTWVDDGAMESVMLCMHTIILACLLSLVDDGASDGASDGAMTIVVGAHTIGVTG